MLLYLKQVIYNTWSKVFLLLRCKDKKFATRDDKCQHKRNFKLGFYDVIASPIRNLYLLL